MFAPLSDVRVVDLTHVLAGPYCSQLLALLGAEVVKVEPPVTGDLTRFTGPIPELNELALGLGFCTQNSDKASITVNLKEPEGVEIVRRLVAASDVFIESFRPGVAERLGLGFDALGAVRPGLVYVSLTAYGQDGPIGHRPAYDHVVQAMSGIMQTTGTEATGPVKVGAPYVDFAAGQKGAMATLAAIMEQRRTGQAQRVDSSMLDTALLLMANTLTATANTGERPAKLGNEAASLAPSSGCFETADELLAIAANTERQFRDLCATIDRTELADDERFARRERRQVNAAAFRDLLQAELRRRPAAEWELAFDQRGVPASRVRSLDELLSEGQPAARGLLSEVDVAGRAVSLPTAGFKVNGHVPAPVAPPRPLGADTDALLAEIGYDGEMIGSLRDKGII
ncbi:MAG: CoA transferase [Acidimicrobiia bacterium]|nr:CoA transferase [Acidimicrobiia bacterium]